MFHTISNTMKHTSTRVLNIEIDYGPSIYLHHCNVFFFARNVLAVWFLFFKPSKYLSQLMITVTYLVVPWDASSCLSKQSSVFLSYMSSIANDCPYTVSGEHPHPIRPPQKTMRGSNIFLEKFEEPDGRFFDIQLSSLSIVSSFLMSNTHQLLLKKVNNLNRINNTSERSSYCP